MNSIRNTSSTKQIGPSRTFTELQVIRAVKILGERKTIGRTLLSRLLKTGPGAIRTLINDLEKNEIIKVDRSGCRLTKKGQDIYLQINENIPIFSPIDAGRLSVAKCDAAVLVKNPKNMIHRGIEQRDAAIKIGAMGATTLLWDKGKFMIPMGSKNCSRDFPDDVWKRLEDKFHPRNGNIIIISSADDCNIALNGALAASLTLLDTTEGR